MFERFLNTAFALSRMKNLQQAIDKLRISPVQLLSCALPDPPLQDQKLARNFKGKFREKYIYCADSLIMINMR